MRLWRGYFGPDATIFGIDINSECKKFDGEAASVRIGSHDPNFLISVVNEMGGIDIVVDDGSHIASHQQLSFKTLFPLLANKGRLHLRRHPHSLLERRFRRWLSAAI